MKYPRRNNITKIAAACFLALLFVLPGGCSHDEMFYEFRTLENDAWHKDSIARFEVNISDSLLTHHVFIELRNNDMYPYKNIWLFVSSQNPSGEIRRDTLECDLADDYGKWHGKGFSLYELSIPYETNIRFPRCGTYIYSIQQGMRDDQLKGISDVGLKIL